MLLKRPTFSSNFFQLGWKFSARDVVTEHCPVHPSGSRGPRNIPSGTQGPSGSGP